VTAVFGLRERDLQRARQLINTTTLGAEERADLLTVLGIKPPVLSR